MSQLHKIKPGLGSGVYTYPEAARLIHVSSHKVAGWAEGYVRVLNGTSVRREGVLERERTREGLLTFFDLIELYFVREFREAGVKLPDIVEAAKLLRERWNTPYPFAYELLSTDGCQLLLEAGKHYESVANRQHVFEFVKQFFKNIEFRDHLAERWWPIGEDKLILIDPDRSFGAPIAAQYGVRTEVLYRGYLAEDRDVEAVADWYEVSPESVKAAVEFEEWLKAA